MKIITIQFVCQQNFQQSGIPKIFKFALSEIEVCIPVEGGDESSAISIATSINNLAIERHTAIIGGLNNKTEDLKRAILAVIFSKFSGLKNCEYTLTQN